MNASSALCNHRVPHSQNHSAGRLSLGEANCKSFYRLCCIYANNARVIKLTPGHSGLWLDLPPLPALFLLTAERTAQLWPSDSWFITLNRTWKIAKAAIFRARLGSAQPRRWCIKWTPPPSLRIHVGPKIPAGILKAIGNDHFQCGVALLLRLWPQMEAFLARAASSAPAACPIIREAVVCIVRGLREVNNP